MNTDITPIFPTLRSVGYIACEHPRVDMTPAQEYRQCADCGALQINGAWRGGHLEFKRLPLRVR